MPGRLITLTERHQTGHHELGEGYGRAWEEGEDRCRDNYACSQRRIEPNNSAEKELSILKRDGALWLLFPKHRGDDVAAENEEDVDADVSAEGKGNLRRNPVHHQHCSNGDGANAVEVGNTVHCVSHFTGRPGARPLGHRHLALYQSCKCRRAVGGLKYLWSTLGSIDGSRRSRLESQGP